MAEIRVRRRRPEWPLWLLAAAAASAVWASAALTAADHASWAPGVVWISPAPVVLLAAWWRGLPGASIAASGVVLGGLAHAEVARDAPLATWMWPVLGLAYAAIYGLAATWLRRCDVDLRRSGLLHTGRFVVASVAASLAIGAVAAALASQEPSMADRVTTALVLALIDVSTVVVAVPLAFVLRGTRVRRTRRRHPGVASYVVSVGFGVGVVLLSSAAGVQIDLLAVGLVALVLVALAHDRRQRDASARRLAGELAFERARVGSLVASAPDGYLSLDSLGHVEAANHVAAQLFAARHAALVGRSIVEVLPPPHDTDPAAHLAALLSSSSAATLWHGHDLSGRPIVVSLEVTRIDAGEQWGYGVVVRSAADQARADHLRTDRVTHDVATGLPNRLLFEDRLASALESQRRRPTGLAVLLVDIDTTATEQALAAALRDCVRQSDTVARLETTRYAVLCRPCPNLGSATTVATRIVDAVRPIGAATIGIAMAFDASMRPDTLLAVADAALAEAGTIGDNQFRVADSSIDAPGSVGTDIDLRDGVLAERLVLRYQPILDLASGDVVAVEALSRLRADDGVLVVPADLVTTAEDAGTVDELGAAVIRQALLDLVVVRTEEGAGEMRVTVNVSPNQLTKGDLLGIVRRSLEEAALPARALVLEISEATPLDTMPEAVEVLRELYAIGVGVALDDFGTGFTRLDLIHDLPLDAVKIDRTFVHRFLDNAIDRDIIEMIVALAQRRGLTVIAEGVETVEQADLLARVGCSHAQGFLFGQPVDVDELRYLLREWQIVPAIATNITRER